MKYLYIARPGSKRAAAPVKRPAARQPEAWKGLVLLEHEGQRVVAVVAEDLSAERVKIELTLPDAAGLLHKTGSFLTSEKAALTRYKNGLAMSDAPALVKEWDGAAELDVKAPVPVHQNGDKDLPVIDYKDVSISGYLSTFVGTTPSDRDGDYVMDGAFNDTLAEFKRNPVMLYDHRNSVPFLAGSFTKIGTTAQGLSVEGKLSNAPDIASVRFKVAEGHLKTMSMGGIFYYADDGRGIKMVRLFEGSLVPIPANPDAMFNVRSLSVVTASKMFRTRFPGL